MSRRMRWMKPREVQGNQFSYDGSIATSLYDATSGGSLVAGDGMARRVEDQSGNGYHLTEATNGPQRKIGLMNGLDTLYFDGTNDKLTQSAASQSKFLHVAAGATFAAVAHFGASSNPDAFYSLVDNTAGGSANTGISVGYDDRAAVPRNNAAFAIATRSGVGQPTSSVAVVDKITPNAPTTVSIVFDNGNGTAYLRLRLSINGAPEFGGNTFATVASASDPTYPLVIGALNPTPSSFLLGYVSEINGWNRLLSDAVRKRISNSRQRKWRING